MKNIAIVLASGSGSRFGNGFPKQFIKVAGKSVMEHTLSVFEKSKKIDEIILVIPDLYRKFVEEILIKSNFKKIKSILSGGETRKESSKIAINSVTDEEANVIIHDCARPFLSEKIIDDCIKALKNYEAVDVAIPCSDTIIRVKDNFIVDIPKRSELESGQTPQCFRLSLIKKAHKIAENDEDFTDDCGIIVKYNLARVFIVNGSNENIKITYPNDIDIADKIFQSKKIDFTENIDLNLLKDKVLVVFGGNSGIGKSIIDLAQKYNAKTFSLSLRDGCDIKDYSLVEKNLEKIYKINNRVDFVIQSAGILRIGKLVDRDMSDIINEIETNYIGSINVAKASIPYLKKSSGSLLFFTSSSYTRGRALYSIYSSSKSAISNLTQALAEELVIDKIKVNAINPERTATPMRYMNFGKENQDSLLDPEEVAKKSLDVLLSEITGEIISVRKNK